MSKTGNKYRLIFDSPTLKRDEVKSEISLFDMDERKVTVKEEGSDYMVVEVEITNQTEAYEYLRRLIYHLPLTIYTFSEGVEVNE